MASSRWGLSHIDRSSHGTCRKPLSGIRPPWSEKYASLFARFLKRTTTPWKNCLVRRNCEGHASCTNEVQASNRSQVPFHMPCISGRPWKCPWLRRTEAIAREGYIEVMDTQLFTEDRSARAHYERRHQTYKFPFHGCCKFSKQAIVYNHLEQH